MAARIATDLARYEKRNLSAALCQTVTTLGSYFVLWVLMYYSLRFSYPITLLLALPAAGFLVRIYVILHDSGHGSFCNSYPANDYLGAICGFLVFTPHQQRRHSHSIHHATSGNLTRRTMEDFPVTITVSEYLALPVQK